MIHYISIHRVDNSLIEIYDTRTTEIIRVQETSLRRAMKSYLNRWTLPQQIISIYEVEGNVGEKKQVIAWIKD